MNSKIALYALSCTFVLALFALHAQGQGPSAQRVRPAGSNVNVTTEIVSSVPNVTVTKFGVLSPQSMGLDLKYSGTGKSPALKLDSYAVKINSKFQDISNQIGALKYNSTGLNVSDYATKLNAKLGRLDDILLSSNATKSLDTGWKSPKSVTMKLKGNTTLDDAQFITIDVH